MSLAEFYNEMTEIDRQMVKEAEEIYKLAAEEEAAGRILARGFIDELNKLAKITTFDETSRGVVPGEVMSPKEKAQAAERKKRQAEIQAEQKRVKHRAKTDVAIARDLAAMKRKRAIKVPTPTKPAQTRELSGWAARVKARPSLKKEIVDVGDLYRGAGVRLKKALSGAYGTAKQTGKDIADIATLKRTQ